MAIDKTWAYSVNVFLLVHSSNHQKKMIRYCELLIGELKA